MIRHQKWHHVEEEERRKWQNPEAILAEIGLKPGSTFMDIGCGEGFFTLPAARMVGPSGKVFGLDIDSGALEAIRQKASAEGLHNLELKAGAAEDVLLCHSCADLAFLGIVLHDFEDPSRVLENIKRMLKPAGRLVNLDWKKEPGGFGPPVSKRFDEAKASGLIESAGFKINSVRDAGRYHYLIIASLA